MIGARRRLEAVVLAYERYLQLAGGRERIAATLDQQTREASETLDADEALERLRMEPAPVPACASGTGRLASRGSLYDRARMFVALFSDGATIG